MSNDLALLPCPFCGGEPHIERDGTARVSMIIVCDDCGCTLESSDTTDGARFAGYGLCWNRRYSNELSATQAELDGADKVIANLKAEREELKVCLEAFLTTKRDNAHWIDRAMALLGK